MYHQIRHPGPDATLEKMEKKYYWQNMRKDVIKWVKECVQCGLCKVVSVIWLVVQCGNMVSAMWLVQYG